MEINCEGKYKEAPALIRLASVLINNRKIKDLSPYAQRLVNLSNEQKFVAYPLNLINSNSNGNLYKVIKPFFKDQNQEKNVINLNQGDSHFIDSIGVTDIDKNKDRILESFNNYYKNGNFERLNRACYRFLKRLKDVNEYDMNDAVLRYMVSCICLKDYSQCYNILESLAQEYTLFDFNIYIFFLNLCEGKYKEASKRLLKIKTNIYDEFNTYITEEDLSFYFAFCLLYNFNIDDYKKVLSENDIYVYKLYDKYRSFFDIVDSYYKCDYLKVNNEFNKKLKDKINKDPFLCGKSDDIEAEFKEKILKEILGFSTEISFKTISDLLVVNKNIANEMVLDLIKKGSINAVIDDINEVVIMVKTNPFNDLLIKSNQTMEKNLDELIKFSYGNIKNKINVIDNKNVSRKQLSDREMDPTMMQYIMMSQG